MGRERKGLDYLAPYGYGVVHDDNGTSRLVRDESEQNTITLVRMLSQKGWSATGIARRLSELNRVSRTGGRFQAQQVLNMLDARRSDRIVDWFADRYQLRKADVTPPTMLVQNDRKAMIHQLLHGMALDAAVDLLAEVASDLMSHEDGGASPF